MRPTAYFHGQPGAPLELGLLPPLPADLFAPDRNRDRSELSAERYYDHLAQEIRRHWPDGGLRLVGFSIGAFVACEVALRLSDRDLALDLISPAAPLGLGDFLPQMAGGPVFRLARDNAMAFRVLTWAQGLVARGAPDLLLDQLFASAAGEDAGLARSAEFRRILTSAMNQSLGQGAVGYRRDLRAYVRTPPDRFAGLGAPMTLWHGSADTWAPLGMSQALAAQDPGRRQVRVLTGQSHYSTLIAAAGELFAAP